MPKAAEILKRCWFAPEVIQTSSMDCGPASLKCLLEGFNIPVSYGRLREACQTNVDGASIDMLEQVATQLGVCAEQRMLPIDHIFLSEAAVLPALLVARLADGATHFVVAWRRIGHWLQIMDPATGRRWVRARQFANELFRHEFPVSAQEWLAWAATAEFIDPLRQRIAALGISTETSNRLIEQALAEADWFALAKLDAAVRMLNSLMEAGGIHGVEQVLTLLKTLLAQVDPQSGFGTIPIAYWSVVALSGETDFAAGQQTGEDKILLLKGAVLLQVKGLNPDQPKPQTESTALSAELEAALTEKPFQHRLALLELLKADGILSPLALIAALSIAAAAVLLETLLFRGVFDMAWELKSIDQRFAAVLSLEVFLAILLLMELPIVMESMRFGRQLEVRLRMALLRKLPQLTDRYFQSRPISDMAERCHNLALIRQVPGLGIQFVQTFWDIVFTLAGIVLIDRASAPLACVITALSIAIPVLAQPLLNETDLRVRSQAAALFGFYLDALLGLVPIRSHRAELAVRREHEALLVEWAHSGRSMIQLSLLVEGLQSLLCFGLVAWLLFQHFLLAKGISGSDLLLVYWALKLPAIGQKLTGLARQYPAQRNILLRLLEPLSTPEEIETQAQNSLGPQPCEAKNPDAAGIEIQSGHVIAVGHGILTNLNLSIQAGEHIAIVGRSGAGKSTLLGLLLGWHKLAAGRLLIDGQALNAKHLVELRQQTAWVDPAIQLWNNSFLENLVYSTPEPGMNNVSAVIEAAALREVLQKLPLGLQTYLGEGGSLLSGGEGQRLRLARALLQDEPRLVLLDEPFRGIDRSRRSRLLNDARTWWQAATLICVTHDVAETQSFSRVLVIEDGQIIEDDEPRVLASRDSRYRDLLNTEKQVNRNMWQGKQWRRLRIDGGKLTAHVEDRKHG